jgi:hypothetical protein
MRYKTACEAHGGIMEGRLMNLLKNRKPVALIGAALLTLGLVNTSFGADPLAKQHTSIGADGKQWLFTSKLKSIIVTSFFYNYNHKDGIPNLVTTLTDLGKAEGWKVDVIADGNLITATKLKDYQVLFGNYISSWASSGKFTNKDAVQAWVEGGGGMFIMHAAGDSKQSANWDWYYKVAHPVLYLQDNPAGKGPASTFIPGVIKKHPVMEGISFQGKDTTIFGNAELHRFTKLITDVYPKADVFLKVDGNNCGTCTSPIYKTPGGYPISWTFPVMKGRVGYFMEGHDLTTMTSMHVDVWNKFFKQFMYYMAGYDSIEVSTNVKIPANMNIEPSGITFHPSDEVGVFLSLPGNHRVSLFDVAGHLVKEINGSTSPIDYDFSKDLQGAKSGIYVMRVTLGNKVASKRFYVR